MPWRLSSFAAVLFAWLLFPRIASAHAELLGSDPPTGSSMERSPTELRLFFSEPVTPGLTELSLIDERGRRLDRGPGRIDSENGRLLSAMVDELPPGVYTLSYRALSSIDGHIDRGVITFAIGTTDSIPPQSAIEILRQQDFWTSGALRWMSYLAVLLLLGLPAFRVFVAGSSRAGLSSTQLAALDTRLTRLLLCSAITLAISSLGQIVEQSFQLADSGSLGGVLAAAESLVVRTRYGGIWLGRLVLAAAVAGVLKGHLQVSAAERTQRWGGAVILAVLTLYTFATLSHASSALDASWIGLVLSWVHLISISVWLGGLAGLLLSASLGVSARLAAAFRGIATGSVAMILISGIGQSLLLVGDVRALTQTLHGQLLLLKLVAVLGAVVVAWQVRQIALARARSGLHALPRLIAQLRLEFGLGATALGLTALLVYLPPAWQTYRQQLRARPTDAETIVHDLKWSTRIQPGRPG
ncbi:MAG TPA: copper resistance protein CopC, partial [Chloroflexota bacterium]|nr:copper resistance protein CopC [Chloroflexota bacterium]